jgi:co-chaperonin GroES (HSP10)
MSGNRIRPRQGYVLLAMDLPEALSPGGITIPDAAQEVSQRGRVVRFGIWRQARNGTLIAHPCDPGALVLISPRAGRWLDPWANGEEKYFKIIDERLLLAVLSNIAP